MTHPLDLLKKRRDHLKREADANKDRLAELRWVRDMLTRHNITRPQQRLAYALFRDISDHTGYPSEQIKQVLKFSFCREAKLPHFSLSYVCDRSVASEFITFVIAWMDERDIPLQHDPREAIDDVAWYIQRCIEQRVCTVCGERGEVHHIDAIGAGRNRHTYDDSDHRKICLCRKHHSIAHSVGWQTFCKKFHLEAVA